MDISTGMKNEPNIYFVPDQKQWSENAYVSKPISCRFHFSEIKVNSLFNLFKIEELHQNTHMTCTNE